MAFPAKKQPPLTLEERIKTTADKVRALDIEIKTVIDEYLDLEKSKFPGLPRQSLEVMLLNRWGQPWHAILGLEQERSKQ